LGQCAQREEGGEEEEEEEQREEREDRDGGVEEDGKRYGSEFERGKRVWKEEIISEMPLCLSPFSSFPPCLHPPPHTEEERREVRGEGEEKRR
jgi:hypothetical protein